MIHFKCIRYKNILSTGNTFTEILLDKNQTTLIVGENGAGKSTILDALSFGLYGKPFRKVNKNQLINSINGKGALVEVEFLVGKKHYKIIRGIKPNVFEVYADGNLIDQNADAKEYQELVENQILKLNHKSFAQIVILGSASFVPFMQLPAAHRREIIEDLLDLQVFSTMNSLLKDKVAENKTKIIDVDYRIKSSADKIETHKKYIESLKQNADEIVQQKLQKIAELNQSIQDANTELSTYNAAISAANDGISDFDNTNRKYKQVDEISRSLTVKIKTLQKDVHFFEANDDCPTCRQSISNDHKHSIVERNNTKIEEVTVANQTVQQEVATLRARLTEIDGIKQAIQEQSRQVSNLTVQINTWTKFIAGINTEIVQLQSNNKIIDDSDKQINDLKAGLKTAIKEKEDLLKDKQVYDVASMMLKDTGIKTRIIKQYIPVINKLINKYLAAMDFFVNFELNENFEETIKSRFRDEFTYDSFSEGEKMRIDLALLFSWRTIAKLRNSASTNLLIMDEVFDSSLDGNGTDEFMKILMGLTSDTNTFIISHKGDQLFEKFEHVVKFEKHKNFSRMV